MTFDYVSHYQCLWNARNNNNKNTRMHAIKVRSIFLLGLVAKIGGKRAREWEREKGREQRTSRKLTKNYNRAVATKHRSAFTLFGIYLFAHIVQTVDLFSPINKFFGGCGAMFAESNAHCYVLLDESEMPMRDVSNPYPFNICFIHFLNSCSPLTHTASITIWCPIFFGTDWM